MTVVSRLSIEEDVEAELLDPDLSRVATTWNTSNTASATTVGPVEKMKISWN
jgi:hypothetical protein